MFAGDEGRAKEASLSLHRRAAGEEASLSLHRRRRDKEAPLVERLAPMACPRALPGTLIEAALRRAAGTGTPFRTVRRHHEEASFSDRPVVTARRSSGCDMTLRQQVWRSSNSFNKQPIVSPHGCGLRRCCSNSCCGGSGRARQCCWPEVHPGHNTIGGLAEKESQSSGAPAGFLRSPRQMCSIARSRPVPSGVGLGRSR